MTGYKEGTAGHTAAENLKKPQIKKKIAQLAEHLSMWVNPKHKSHPF